MTNLFGTRPCQTLITRSNLETTVVAQMTIILSAFLILTGLKRFFRALFRHCRKCFASLVYQRMELFGRLFLG